MWQEIFDNGVEVNMNVISIVNPTYRGSGLITCHYPIESIMACVITQS